MSTEKNNGNNISSLDPSATEFVPLPYQTETIQVINYNNNLIQQQQQQIQHQLQHIQPQLYGNYNSMYQGFTISPPMMNLQEQTIPPQYLNYNAVNNSNYISEFCDIKIYIYIYVIYFSQNIFCFYI